ncbi:hypothetical protein ACA910_000515 [Epithemia clementina (nom. ined.)]
MDFPRQPAAQQPKSPVDSSQSMPYYGLCFVGGALSSSIRWIKTPLDNVKCNMQVYPSIYPSFRQGLVVIYRSEGVRGLYRGLVPTVLAYGTQTGVKYGMYEVMKSKITSLINDDQVVREYRGLIYVASAACAEAVADVLMCPWEMLKVRTQTDPTFPKKFLHGLRLISTEPSFPFGSLAPLMCRQLPSTIVNFYTFENTVNLIYKHGLKKPKESCNTMTQLGVTFAAGYGAGFFSTTCSHLPDSLVSLKARPEFANASYVSIIRQVGLWELSTKGLGPRVAITGSVIGFQWLFYDSFKTCLGLGTSGGSEE